MSTRAGGAATQADSSLPPVDSPAERTRLALELGDRDLRIFAGAQHLDLDTARRLLEAKKHLGRRKSCAQFSRDA